ncbi:MAG: magnesium-translocating P-type ATPase [Rhodospirillaceae bacterium]|nr:magnesium-translocating P-type ATPase [Rhodospirillaceae bacterium]
MSAFESGDPFWSRSAAEIGEALGSSPAGIGAAQAAERLRQHGPNSVEEAGSLSGARLLLRQFESPLVIILVFGAGISLVLRDWTDAGIILAIVLGSTLLGFSQEYRASAAIQQLKRQLALTSRVLRDGVEATVAAASLVPGDVVLLSAGNLIPADGLILEAKDFLVSEASLTGESFPVEKRPGLLPADTALTERTNSVFLGASVRSGTAKAMVVKTGRATAFGTIAARLRARPPETEFQRGLRQFGYLLVRVMTVIVLFVLAMNVLLDRPGVESLLFAVALAVGLSPELLPAIVSVTLSSGARRMAREGVIVRHLEAIENLGGMDILCTDKTGTLTAGVISLDRTTDAAGLDSDRVRRLAYLNAALETGIANPLDAAIVAAGAQHGLTTQGCRKIDEIPYDFLRKRLTIVIEEDGKGGEYLIVTKGAFAEVMQACGSLRREGGTVPLTPALRAEIENYCRDRGDAGFRLLAVATRRLPARATYGRDDEAEMVLEGFLHFFDPPKPDAGAAIQALARLGIRIKVISGDNRYVTRHVAEAIGLNPKSLLTGAEIAALRDEALRLQAPRTDLFVEVDPQQKERIVRALQRAGHAVGFLGDGINDAPALHAADVGISVSEAVDVARESADIVLLRRDLGVLRRGVEDGRRTFANTLKYICITTSANFGNMVSMALATPFLPFLPLAAKQILLNNFMSDLPSIAIATDNVDPGHIARAQRWRIKDVQRFMVVFGLISSVFDLITFATLLFVLRVDEGGFQTIWFVISLLTELAVVLILRTQMPAWRSRPSRLLTWMTVATAIAAFAFPFLGELAKLFSFEPLSATQLAAIVAIVGGYLMATEAAKRWFYRHRRRG